MEDKGEKNKEAASRSLSQTDPRCFEDAPRTLSQLTKHGDPRLDFYMVYARVAAEYDRDLARKYGEDFNIMLVFAGLIAAVCSTFVTNIDLSMVPGIASSVPLYMSLTTSFLVTCMVLLGKQWINRYTQDLRGSIIERCGDRQRKCDGLEKWSFDVFIINLSIMLQLAVGELAFGVLAYIVLASRASDEPLIIPVFTASVAIVILSYTATFISGSLYYGYPFEIPGRHTLPRFWRKDTSPVFLLSTVQAPCPSPGPPLPTTPLQTIPPQSLPPRTIPHATPDAFLEANADDIWCISWILQRIIDPEALDAAIRLAGIVRWFEDETNPEPPYDQIISILTACFDSTGKLYPGSRDRAYYSAKAILWIHIRAMRASEEFSRRFPLPSPKNHRSYDPDLHSLLRMYDVIRSRGLSAYKDVPMELNTPVHTQWTSDVLLHLCWAKKRDPDALGPVFPPCDVVGISWDSIPLDATLNFLLVWFIHLGSSVEGEMLEIQDKHVSLEWAVSLFSSAIIEVIPASSQHHRLVRKILLELSEWDDRPSCLRDAAYEWFSAICKGYPGLEDGEDLLFLSLKICSRGLDIRHRRTDAEPVDTENRQLVRDVIFNSGDAEAISDFLQAWITHDRSQTLFKVLDTWPMYPGLQNAVSTSQRLRQLIIHSVEHVDPLEVEEIGVEPFTALLGCLGVGVEDMVSGKEWLPLFLNVVGSQDNPSSSDPYWKLMAELVSDDLKDVALSLFRKRPETMKKLGRWMEDRQADVAPERLEGLQWICDQVMFGMTSQRTTSLETGEFARSSSSTFPSLVGAW